MAQSSQIALLEVFQCTCTAREISIQSPFVCEQFSQQFVDRDDSQVVTPRSRRYQSTRKHRPRLTGTSIRVAVVEDEAELLVKPISPVAIVIMPLRSEKCDRADRGFRPLFCPNYNLVHQVGANAQPFQPWEIEEDRTVRYGSGSQYGQWPIGSEGHMASREHGTPVEVTFLVSWTQPAKMEG